MNKRIESVDILRGVTIAAMILVNTPGTWSHIYLPLSHAKWHGLTPTDLIFPFFLFIVGISIYFSYKKKIRNITTYKKITIRSLKLIGLGLFLNIFTPYFPFFSDFNTVRIPGVLQRIGIVFFVSSILYINLNWKVLLGIGTTILISYWFVLGFLPFSDGTLPTFNRAPNNWANYIDLTFLGKHMWQADYDPEGLFSTLPSIVTCISGILIGKILDSLKTIKLLIITAFTLLVSGYILSNWFPINKAIWSSTFVLVTSGWATLILAIIYYLKDSKKLKFGTIFKYVGMNAITIYFLSSLITKCMYLKVNKNNNLHNYLYNTIFVHSFFSDKTASLLYALTVVFFYIGVSYLMFKKKIFIKI